MNAGAPKYDIPLCNIDRRKLSLQPHTVTYGIYNLYGTAAKFNYNERQTLVSKPVDPRRLWPKE